MIRASLTRRCGIAAAALAVVAAVLPAQSLAATGTTRLALDGPAASALREQGVRIAPLKPATGGGERASLPVAAGLAGSTTSLLRHRGGLLLEAGGEKARLTGLSLLLGKRSRVTARLGGEEIDLFRVPAGGRRQVDPVVGTAVLANLPLKLTGSGARALAGSLGLARIAPGRFGTLSSNAAKLTPAGAPAGGGAGSGGGTTSPASSACPLPGGAGPDAPAVLPPGAAPPPGALTVTTASLAWRVRESFIRYIATGEGTSASGGATADPAELLTGASAPLSYGFRFPFSDGWLDPGANPADPADDRAALHFAGALRFRYGLHKLDLETAKPEIEIDGASSRAIFSISDNGAAAQRQVLVNLDLSRAAAITQTGSSYTYDRVPGAVPGGTASSVFAGFYPPGTDFGCFSLSFSTGP